MFKFLSFRFPEVYIEISFHKKSLKYYIQKVIDMSTTKMDSIRQYFVGSLIVSVIGAFTILLGDSQVGTILITILASLNMDILM